MRMFRSYWFSITYKTTFPVALAAMVTLASSCSSPQNAASQDEAPGKSSQATTAKSSAATLAPGRVVLYPPVPLDLSPERPKGDNLLAYPGFEAFKDASPTGWMLSQGGKAIDETDPMRVADGDHSLRLDAVGASCEVTQTVKAAGRAAYTFRAVAMTDTLTGKIHLEARNADAAGQAFLEKGPEVAIAKDQWTAATMRFEPVLSVRNIQLALVYMGGASEKGSLWWDMTELRTQPAVRKTSLLKNGDLDEWTEGKGPTNWDATGITGLAKATGGEALDGAAALRIDLDDSVNFGLPQLVTGIQPGGKYILRGYIKCNDLNGNACLEIQHGTQGFAAFLMDSTPPITGTTDWTLVSTEFTAPAGMDSVLVFLRRPNPATPTGKKGSVWFDACELFPAPAGTP